jgi:hypothetical protein
MNSGIILSAIIENIATRADGTVKVVLGCQEMSASRAGELMTLSRKLAAVYVSPKDSINQKEIDQCDAIDPVMPAKTCSQRMRAVLYVLWQQQPEGFKDFETFYKWKMESYIDQIKSNLNP